ncbi:energy transducer TonB [uncultured Psychroserpens sp.]|uniref:energy transducer TonB n=1 Tax=uncultured Psychroserpens sp. TaxID=255436 RepID=UPI002620FC8A|nr:energy transducer TonB [uncultured Psychroserpens sp.]
MKDFDKSHNIAGQSNKTVQKPHKHDANLQKNSSLYFQIGLILCLLGTYAMFEMQFEHKATTDGIVYLEPDEDMYFTTQVIPEPDTPKQDPAKQQKKKIILTQPPKVVDHTDSTPETPEFLTAPDPTPGPIVDPDSVVDPGEVDTIPEVFTLVGVEVVPIYPGCEKKKTNKERVKCMSDKLGRLVQKKFNTDLAAEHGLSGVQKIQVQFKIGPNGNITEVLTRAPHPSLEKEAERLTKKIPQMKPGLQRDKPVSVIYNLPIVFKVDN